MKLILCTTALAFVVHVAIITLFTSLGMPAWMAAALVMGAFFTAGSALYLQMSLYPDNKTMLFAPLYGLCVVLIPGTVADLTLDALGYDRDYDRGLSARVAVGLILPSIVYIGLLAFNDMDWDYRFGFALLAYLAQVTIGISPAKATARAT